MYWCMRTYLRVSIASLCIEAQHDLRKKYELILSSLKAISNYFLFLAIIFPQRFFKTNAAILVFSP